MAQEKKEKNTEMTPMMLQYRAAKEQHPNELLFFRLGDFYEMFFEDARVASRELGITLTSRCGDTEKMPMCGVPYHAAETYITRLIAKGYKVAIAEQIGDPKAPGLTQREVIKIVTPGTVLNETALTDTKNNYIALLAEDDDAFCLAAADITTGECFYGIYRGKNRLSMLEDELYRLMMPELLFLGICSARESVVSFVRLRVSHCVFTNLPDMDTQQSTLLARHFAVAEHPTSALAVRAVTGLLQYLHDVVKNDLTHLNRLIYLDAADNLVLDATTLRNLEITSNLRDGGRKNTLLDVLDFTKTSMGGRMLKRWLEYPLLSISRITERLDAVQELKEHFSLRQNMRGELQHIYDFERLLTRVEVGTANARDLVALKLSFCRLPSIHALLQTCTSTFLQHSYTHIRLFDALASLLESALVESPGLSLREGGIIKDGYSEELDEYRRIAHDSKTMLQEIEERERQETGIKTLKIGYNKVFGYYIEIRNSGKDLVPEHYIRKQTLSNAERYITEELKAFETKILGAQEKSINLEYAIFVELRNKIADELVSIQETAREIAKVDVLAALAEAAEMYHYVRPHLTDNGEIRITDGRHPLVERLLSQTLFVPNDTTLNHQTNEIVLITGPNMAGKSTFMRQTALLTLMAQIGCFVPAREAFISPVDRIFTRIGASDDLVSGQSTFMVEMNEVAQILKNATKDSLVILDEIGRGTSTFDGMSIARAVVEYIRDAVHAKTMFATHYHELTDLADEHVQNYCVAVKERGGQVDFLRRIVAGSADKSYGIHVAQLAGLPRKVTQRAQEILDCLEADSAPCATVQPQGSSADVTPSATNADGMSSLFDGSIQSDLLAMDVMSMTPIEALNALYKLQQQAKEEAGKA